MAEDAAAGRPDVELLPATGVDVEWVHDLLERADLPTDDLSATRAADGPALYVVRSEAGRVGCIGVERYGDDGLLRSAVVLEEYRGEGYGRAAVRALETESRDSSIGTLYLLTTTAADFFERLGYERVERAAVPEAVRESAEFSDLCPSSAVAMCRRL